MGRPAARCRGQAGLTQPPLQGPGGRDLVAHVAELDAEVDRILSVLAPRRADAKAYVRDQRTRRIFRMIEKHLAAGKHQEILGILQQDTLGDIPGLVDRLQRAAAFPDGEHTPTRSSGPIPTRRNARAPRATRPARPR